jgi:hypothetical protein
MSATRTTNGTVSRKSGSRKVYFSEEPPRTEGYFFRELLKESLTIGEIDEIIGMLRLRSKVTLGPWRSFSSGIQYDNIEPEGNLSGARNIPSGMQISTVPLKTSIPTRSKKVLEEHIGFIINSLVELINLEIDPTIPIIKQISILVKKKRAINTLRVLYGLDLSDENTRIIWSVNDDSFNYIDEELESTREIIRAQDDMTTTTKITHSGGSLSSKNGIKRTSRKKGKTGKTGKKRSRKICKKLKIKHT